MSTAPSDLKEGDDVSFVLFLFVSPSDEPFLLSFSDSSSPFPPAPDLPPLLFPFLLLLFLPRWKWGSSHPSGKVDAVVEGDASITTKSGNSVNRHGSERKEETEGGIPEEIESEKQRS